MLKEKQGNKKGYTQIKAHIAINKLLKLKLHTSKHPQNFTCIQFITTIAMRLYTWFKSTSK